MIYRPQLSTTDWTQLTNDDLMAIDEALQSDGCTGATQFYRPCCVLHDWYYRTGIDFDFETVVDRREADHRMRLCQQGRSPFGTASPMAWWRWAFIRTVGRFFYHPQPVVGDPACEHEA